MILLIDRVKPIMKGILVSIPGVKTLFPPKKRGTISARYCYSVWMRHLVTVSQYGNKELPSVVAELGPGESIGVGLCALLSNCDKYYTLDVIKYWNISRIIEIYNELIELFNRKENIPDDNEFPETFPKLSSYEFPSAILTDEILNKSLKPDRIDKIRNDIETIDSNKNSSYINYFIPWNNPSVIQENSIDFIISQAVLEHVEDLENTYKYMYSWLKEGGIMSHEIDFRSHGLTKNWNGHWLFSDFEWKLIKGRKKFLINRFPYSMHVKLNNENHFEIKEMKRYTRPSKIKKSMLAKKYRNFSEEDLTTYSMYIMSEKKLPTAEN